MVDAMLRSLRAIEFAAVFADMLVLIEAMQLILCDGGGSLNLFAFINGSAVPK